MATNADTADDDGTRVTDETIRNLKYPDGEVETSTEEDEIPDGDEAEDEQPETGADDDQIDDDANDDSEEDSTDTSQFVKEFPNIKGDTPEEYAKNLEIAYKNSTAEALRLKGLAEASRGTPAPTGDDEEETPLVDTSNPLSLWAQQELDSRISKAFDNFKRDYPQVLEAADNEAFVKTVAQLSRTILDSEKRLAPPEELYQKSAVILGWERQSQPTEKEKLGAAFKDAAASSKTSSATKKTPKSKVTDAQVRVGRQMFPGLSDQEIRQKLEPHIK